MDDEERAQVQAARLPVHAVLVERTAARVILLDPADRLLLMRGHDPAVPDAKHWFTVGGGLDEGESLVQGAVREIYEETGLVVDAADVGAPVHADATQFGFGSYWVVQSQEYVVVRAPHGWEPSPAALEQAEVDTVDRWAWWTADQLRAHGAGTPHDGPGGPDEPVYPRDLPDVLDRVLRR